MLAVNIDGGDRRLDTPLAVTAASCRREQGGFDAQENVKTIHCLSNTECS